MTTKDDKIVNRVPEAKGLVIFLAVISLVFLLFIVIFNLIYGSENSINFRETIAKIVVYSLLYIFILFLSYALYVTRSVNTSKNIIKIMEFFVAISIIISAIVMNWVSLLISIIYAYELYKLYLKIDKLEPKG